MIIKNKKNYIKKLLRKLLAFFTQLNPRFNSILNPGLIHYRIFKLTFGFIKLFYKYKDPNTKKLKQNKFLISENNEYFEDYWKAFDEYISITHKD